MIRRDERVDRMANRMEMIPCGSTVAFSLTVIVPSSICVSPSGDHMAMGEETSLCSRRKCKNCLDWNSSPFESLRQISDVPVRFKTGPLPV